MGAPGFDSRVAVAVGRRHDRHIDAAPGGILQGLVHIMRRGEEARCQMDRRFRQGDGRQQRLVDDGVIVHRRPVDRLHDGRILAVSSDFFALFPG